MAVNLHSSTTLKNKIAVFLDCTLDCNSGALTVSGIPTKLEPLVFQFLTLLILHQGNIVSKALVLETLWLDKKVSDEALRAMVKKARDAVNDNARNPSYIKTIPTKGYVLIPPVKLSSTVAQTWLHKQTRKLLILSLFAAATIGAGGWYIFSNQSAPDLEQSVTLAKRSLGQITSKDVSTYYINGAMKNVKVVENETGVFNQLVIDDIQSKQQQKIVFNQALLPKFWWSNRSQRALVMRNDKAGFFTLQFNRQSQEPFITEQIIALPAQTEILAFDYTGSHIFIRSMSDGLVSILQLSTGKIEATAFSRSVQSWLATLSQSLVSNASSDLPSNDIDKASTEVNIDASIESNLSTIDVSIWPAPQSEKLMLSAFVRGVTYFTLFANQNGGQYLSQFTVNGQITSATWSQQGERFSFTGSNAKLYSWQKELSQLTSWNTGGESINRIVADCGGDCFVVANTQELPKLSEVNNPFAQESGILVGSSVDIRKQYAQVILTNTIARNESLPVYSQQGLFFISQHQANTNIMFTDNSGTETLVYQFKQPVQLSELALDSAEEYLAGVINQRLFLLRLSSNEFIYIPATLPFVSHVVFNQNNKLRFHASFTQNPQLDEGNDKFSPQRQVSGVYEYDINSTQISLFKPNIKLSLPLTLKQNATKDVDIAQYNGVLEISNEDGVKVVFGQNKEPLILADIKLACTNCWQISGNYLYRLSVSTKLNESSFLIRTDLLTGESEQQLISLDTLLNEFDLQASTHKIMLTTRQNLRTELMEIKGLKQVF